MTSFTNKKIAVLGLGVEGQDLVNFLLKQGAKLTVFDQKKAPELKAYQDLKKKGIAFKLGPNYLQEGLVDFDLIFRSPGVKPSLAEIKTAQKKGKTISSATKLFFDLSPAKIIGVTGTKGKGTTASLIYEILKEAGKDVHLAGNIGEPMLALLPKLKSTSWVVLELSSFQLIDLEKSPQIGVVLFIVPEHLDYHQDKEEYFEAKANLVRHQRRTDSAVLNADNETSSSFAALTKGKIFCFSRRKKVKGAYVQSKEVFLFEEPVVGVDQLQIRGAHNWENVCAAALASSLAGAGLKAIRKAILNFKGLEHRLELVVKKKGVSFYNDSFSTTPETTIAVIHSFKEPIVLIAGGSEKGSDFTQLGKEISRSSVETLILIGEMASRIRSTCQKAGFKGEIIDGPAKMKPIVSLAFAKVQPGGVVLLSPACASFDLFPNYKERGKLFKKHAQAL